MNSNRSDSDFMETQIMQAALRGIKPPDCVTLQECEMPFWDSIIEARAEWTKIDLIHAANLARALYSIEENTQKLKIEGEIIENQRGTMVMNPRCTVLETYQRRAIMLASKIQVHAAATIGESKLARNKNTKKRESLDAINSIEDDDLIARPLLN